MIDVIDFLGSEIKIFNDINQNTDAVNDLIEAGSIFATNLGIDVTAEFTKSYRLRLKPKKIDDNPENHF